MVNMTGKFNIYGNSVFKLRQYYIFPCSGIELKYKNEKMKDMAVCCPFSQFSLNQ